MFDKKAYMKEYRIHKKEDIAKNRHVYWLKNKEKLLKVGKEYYHSNKEHYAKQAKKYYQIHRDTILEHNKSWRKNNRVRRLQYLKDYMASHRKRLSFLHKEYRKTEKGKQVMLADRHNRRLGSKELTPMLIQQVYEDNIKKYGTLTCELCFKPIMFGQDSLEHFIPISRGGTNEYHNLGIAHRRCNISKNNKTLDEYLQGEKNCQNTT